jgi:peptidoglycan hydrolase CwlO-like protein
MNTVEIIGLVVSSGIALRIVEHFLNRKSQHKSNAKSEIENIDFAGETWQKVVDRLELRIEKLIRQVGDLQDENTKLREDIYSLRTELSTMKMFQQKAEKYEKQVTKLQEKISRYERLLADGNITY